ncbi:MAG TPA: DUF6308 family protein [Jatrophihabitans sp.]|jgi:hypothetical protein|uniref:DUF6308 family protein n=1 Tax=Jatrophihabitans sp. TaxID=1932789 RepID=UPI002EE7C0C5
MIPSAEVLLYRTEMMGTAATVPGMDLVVAATPGTWRVPTYPQLADAKACATAALSDVGDWPVSDRLAAYYELRGNYAGASFTQLQDAHRSSADSRRITVADLHAVSLLSVRVPPAVTRALIDNIDGHTTKVNGALAALDNLGVRHLRDAGPDALQAMDGVATALMAACRRRGTKSTSNPWAWVLVSKIAARKAPDLFPVRDSIVCTALGLIGRGKPQGTWRIDWQVYRALLLDNDVRSAIIAAQDGLADRTRADYGREQDELRVLDAALWTYEIWRMDA